MSLYNSFYSFFSTNNSTCNLQEESIANFTHSFSFSEVNNGVQIDILLSAEEVLGVGFKLEMPAELLASFSEVILNQSWCFDEESIVEITIDELEKQLLINVSRNDCEEQSGEGLILSILFGEQDDYIEEIEENTLLSGVIIMIDDVS